jgi:hypothetical protein
MVSASRCASAYNAENAAHFRAFPAVKIDLIIAGYKPIIKRSNQPSAVGSRRLPVVKVLDKI